MPPSSPGDVVPPSAGAALGELMQPLRTAWCSPAMLCEDTATGRVRTIDGKPQAFSTRLAEADAATIKRGVVLLSELLFAAGGESASCCRSTALASCTTPTRRAACLDRPDPGRRGWEVLDRAHDGHRADGQRPAAPRSPIRSATFHDADRLMVTDASLFPTPIGVNPMETIMGARDPRGRPRGSTTPRGYLA